MSGKLYVVGTPIGNIEDVTIRALKTIDNLQVLVCEDSRVTGKLLKKYQAMGLIRHKPKLFSVNEFNENRMYPRVAEMVENGTIVGLVSDAGMPAFSDPGYRVIRECLDRKLEVEVIPGPTAATTALVWSGIGGELTLYTGFLPKTPGKAKKILRAARELSEKLQTGRMVLYVSVHRLAKDLQLIREELGEVRIVVLREMTKLYQERVEMDSSKLDENLLSKAKGEFVVVVELPK